MSALAAGDSVLVVAAVTTMMVREAQVRHNASPTVTAALGRLMTGAALMGAGLKGRERITLQVNGTGKVRTLVASVFSEGRVRGYPLVPHAEVPLKPTGKFDVGGLVGAGFLHVTRAFETGQPYTSAVPLASGEIGEDLAYYFSASEQVPTAVAVGVLANPTGVVAAGGVMAQGLPGASDATLARLEAAARTLPHVTTLIHDGDDPEALVKRLAGHLKPRLTGSLDLGFYCPCDRSRVVRALIGLGVDELREMADGADDTEARCDFCGKYYYFSPHEIRDILGEASA